MRRKHRPEEPLHYDRWLVSYADFITLLFAFFVVLYASSQVDKAKAAKLASSIQAAFRDVGVESTPEEISPLTELQVPPEASERSIDLGHFVQPVKSSTAADEETKSLSEAETQLKKVLSPEIEQHIVDIKSTREGVVVSLREVGFYESGSAKLRASSKAAVDRLAGVLQQRKEALRIEGDTDNVPIHTSLFDSNWELVHRPRRGLCESADPELQLGAGTFVGGRVCRRSTCRGQRHCGWPGAQPAPRCSDSESFYLSLAGIYRGQ